MSSQLDNTSAILGEYMLKGWTLTDLHCDICHITPLMREPPAPAQKENRERIQFCALCDGGPIKPTPAPTTTNTTTTGSTSSSLVRGNDPAESISQLLLQGYSMLGTNCPNEDCRGIPLVGYPRKKGGERDGRRMCVGCGGRWIDEKDLGRDVKVVERGLSTGAAGSGSGSGSGLIVQGGDGGRASYDGESPRSKKRRELYDVGESIVQRNEEKRAQQSIAPMAVGDDLDFSEDDSTEQPKPTERIIKSIDTLASALTRTTESLTSTLTSLSSSLERHTASSPSHDQSRYFVDIKLHTEAMKDVLEVLSSIRNIHK